MRSFSLTQSFPITICDLLSHDPINVSVVVKNIQTGNNVSNPVFSLSSALGVTEISDTSQYVSRTDLAVASLSATNVGNLGLEAIYSVPISAIWTNSNRIITDVLEDGKNININLIDDFDGDVNLLVYAANWKAQMLQGFFYEDEHTSNTEKPIVPLSKTKLVFENEDTGASYEIEDGNATYEAKNAYFKQNLNGRKYANFQEAALVSSAIVMDTRQL